MFGLRTFLSSKIQFGFIWGFDGIYLGFFVKPLGFSWESLGISLLTLSLKICYNRIVTKVTTEKCRQESKRVYVARRGG